MGSESTSPRLFGDPCHHVGDLYSHFLEQPESAPLTPEPASSSVSSCGKKPLKSMLVTGFGYRSWDSLQAALLDDDQHDQMLAARYDTEGGEEECQSLYSSASRAGLFKASSTTATESSSDVASHHRGRSLEYLLGLAVAQEAYDGVSEGGAPSLGSVQGEAEEEVDPRLSSAMRRARQYLSTHRIFEFFRFLIAHMLSKLPDNPIEFLIDLLDRCLLYRAGFGTPPLLFEKPHLGMKTLGICSFDRRPPTSTEGLICKDFFVEEAYESLTDLFVEMIRRRGGDQTPLSQMTPPPTAVEPSLIGGGQ